MPIDSENFFKTPFWALPIDEVLELAGTNADGLKDDEAKDRLDKFGKNTLPHEKKGLWLKILFNQFTSPLIIILLIAGVITLFVNDIKDSAFIFAAVIVNAALGFYQENKAEAALAKLKTYIKERIRVLREIGRASCRERV